MIKMNQSIAHDPDNNIYGDCQRACIASLLELPMCEVPHFYEKGTDFEFTKLLKKFLSDRGLVELCMYIGKQKVSDYIAAPCYHMIYGKTARGFNHSVVAHNGKIVHDPHFSRAGLLKSEKEKWVYAFLVKSSE